MEICNNCGNTLILKDGKCLHCGKAPNEQVTPKSEGAIEAGPLPVKTFNVNGVSFNMILVEGGCFYYGLDLELLNKEIKSGRDYKARFPLVEVRSFYIGETEVTQALWEAVMEEQDEKIAVWKDKKEIYNPSRFKGKELPVESVNKHDVDKFLKRLNDLTGAGFRLPNGHEWEFAAKGGNKSKGYKYAGSDNIDEVAWNKENSKRWTLIDFVKGEAPKKTTHHVKKKRPNELGIYDMSGNVQEILASEKSRGGYWSGPIGCCAVVQEERWGYSSSNAGFRLALNFDYI